MVDWSRRQPRLVIRIDQATGKAVQTYWADPARENRVTLCHRGAAEAEIFLMEAAAKSRRDSTGSMVLYGENKPPAWPNWRISWSLRVSHPTGKQQTHGRLTAFRAGSWRVAA